MINKKHIIENEKEIKGFINKVKDVEGELACLYQSAHESLQILSERLGENALFTDASNSLKMEIASISRLAIEILME